MPIAPTTHELKTWPVPFDAVWRGVKRFEIRRNDRGFHVGDVLDLREWDPVAKKYSGRTLHVRVTWMLDGPSTFGGVERGFCIMSIEFVRGRM